VNIFKIQAETPISELYGRISAISWQEQDDKLVATVQLFRTKQEAEFLTGKPLVVREYYVLNVSDVFRESVFQLIGQAVTADGGFQLIQPEG
jgi:hypothetical protein